MSTTTSAAAQATTSDVTGTAQTEEGLTLIALITAIASSLAIFGVQVFAFILLRNKLARI